MADGPSPILRALLDRLANEFGETELTAAFDARTKKRPRKRPPELDQSHLIEMAEMIMIPPVLRPRPGRAAGRTVLEQEISWAASQIAPKTSRYVNGKDVAKTLRQKFNKILRGGYLDHGALSNGEFGEAWLGFMTTAVIAQRLIVGQKIRWEPYRESPAGSIILMELEEMDRTVQDIGIRIYDLWEKFATPAQLAIGRKIAERDNRN